jgi:iron complex outermembrane receptor protein
MMGLEDGFQHAAMDLQYKFWKSFVVLKVLLDLILIIAGKANFLWQSSLATGTVPAYSTVDAQVQYTFLRSHLNLKLGGSNLFNKYYYSFIGGPAIGGLLLLHCLQFTCFIKLNLFTT